MSFLGRLFGHSSPAPAPPVTPANAVRVPDDVAAALTAGGQPLGEAVETALRDHLEALARDAERGDPVRPFWLERQEGEPDIEEELRDRLERRRAAEADDSSTAAAAAAAGTAARKRPRHAPGPSDPQEPGPAAASDPASSTP